MDEYCRSRAVAGPDGAALAQNRSIAVAAARPLAVAIARAFASVFGIPLSRAETDSIAVNLDQERFSDSVSNTQTRGPAAADASGEAQADSFLVDENSGLPRLSNGFEVSTATGCSAESFFEEFCIETVDHLSTHFCSSRNTERHLYDIF